MGESEQSGAPHRRRKRYRGTHPRRFDERYKELQPEKYPQMQQHIRSRGRTPAGTHVPVLLREVMECLRPTAGCVAADCTLGYGGHASELIRRISPGGRLMGFDVDGAQLEGTRGRLAPLVEKLGVTLSLHRMNFAGIAGMLARGEGVSPLRPVGGPPAASAAPNDVPSEERTEGAAKRAVLHTGKMPVLLDILLADLGVSSMQIDDPARGISYKSEGPLDMRMDDRIRRTGADLLATLSQADLSRALWELSDEPDHDRIAEFIVQQRQAAPIETTGQLMRLVFHAKGTTGKAWRKQAEYEDLHPAARTFQALRILVNDELASLRELLRVAPSCLKPGGRIGILSFHSGEDRLVKTCFRDGYRTGVWSATSPQPVRPSPREVNDNPRSASAKLRWAVRAG